LSIETINKIRNTRISNNGYAHSKESLDKMVATRTKNNSWKHSDETKEKLRISSTGRKHSDESKLKMSISKVEWHKTVDITGKKNPFYGKNHTDELKLYFKKLYAKHWIVTFPNGNTKTFLGKKEVKQYIMEYTMKNNEKVSYYSLFYYGKNGHNWKVEKK